MSSGFIAAPSFNVSPSIAARLDGLSQVVGNTPLLEIHLQFRGQPRVVYAKYEPMNLTGSIKDRIALNIFRKAYESGALHPGDTVVEATSGNTGIAFAAIGSALGHPVKVFMPDWMSRERADLIRGLGADIVPITRDQGGFLGSIQLCEEFSRKNCGIFLPRQFSNPANMEAHALATGPEILLQLDAIGLKPDAFVAGVGTGGTVMGVGRALRAALPHVCIHPVEPKESPTLSAGRKVGSHRIQGISDDFIPALLDFAQMDSILSISDADSIIAAQKLACELGLGVGISSGCNLLAALEAQDLLSPSATVVTIFSDDNKKYLSTDLMTEIPLEDQYLSSAIEFVGFRSLRRCF